jgi:hypothetical protein
LSRKRTDYELGWKFGANVLGFLAVEREVREVQGCKTMANRI